MDFVYLIFPSYLSLCNILRRLIIFQYHNLHTHVDKLELIFFFWFKNDRCLFFILNLGLMCTIKPHWKSISAWRYGINNDMNIKSIIHYVYTLMKANHGPMVRGLLSKTCRRIFDAFVTDSSRSASDYVVLYVIRKTKLVVPRVWNNSHHSYASIEVDMLNVCLSKYARRLTFEIPRASCRAFHHPFARNRRDWINSSLRSDILMKVYVYRKSRLYI